MNNDNIIIVKHPRNGTFYSKQAEMQLTYSSSSSSLSMLRVQIGR